MSEVTRILSAIEAGDSQAAADLLPLVYDELRKRAAAQLARELVMSRYYAGLSVEEAAAVLGHSPSTVKRDWRRARAWLSRQMGRQGEGS